MLLFFFLLFLSTSDHRPTCHRAPIYVLGYRTPRHANRINPSGRARVAGLRRRTTSKFAQSLYARLRLCKLCSRNRSSRNDFSQYPGGPLSTPLKMCFRDYSRSDWRKPNRALHATPLPGRAYPPPP